MKSFEAASLTPKDNYKLLSGSVIPRPIAWVSTVDADGVRNLAPYSFFVAVSANPPAVCFCPSVREAENGLLPIKDTLVNVRATGEFVVNVVSEELTERMSATSAQLKPGEDEFTLAGLTAMPGERVRAPRVGEAKVQMECRLLQIVEVGTGVMGGSLVLGEVLLWHISEEVLEPGYKIDHDRLRAVGRMAGSDYVRTGNRFTLPRPK